MGNLFYNLLVSFLKFFDGAKKKCRSYVSLRWPKNFKYIMDDIKLVQSSELLDQLYCQRQNTYSLIIYAMFILKYRRHMLI